MGKAVFKTGTLSVGSGTPTVYKLTGISYEKTQGEVDATDTGTTAGETETLPTRTKRTFSADMYMNVAAAFPTFGSEVALSLDLEGFVIAGDGVINNCGAKGQLDGVLALSISGYFSGAVTETADT